MFFITQCTVQKIWKDLEMTYCHQKRRELEREKWRNVDATSQGTHTDPNRIRAAWSF
jgi:hypothetical protein